MKPRFKFHYALMDGWRLDVLNKEAHQLALWWQESEKGSYYPVYNPNSGDEYNPFYYYDIPMLETTKEQQQTKQP